MKPTALALPLLAALALSACAGAKPVPACQLDFLNAAPDRPFEKLGEFEEMVRIIPPGGAREALRSQACAMGADAVVITRSMVVNLLDHTSVQGYAIRWTVAPPPAPAAPAPETPAPTPAPEPDTLKL
jgi:hypothetical protein